MKSSLLSQHKLVDYKHVCANTLVNPGLPLPDPAPYRGRAHIQMHRQAGCRPALGRKQTHFHPVSFARPQPRIAAQLAQSAALPRGHLDVQGVGHEGGGTQGNQRYLRFYLTPTKFHADRLVSEYLRFIVERVTRKCYEKGRAGGAAAAPVSGSLEGDLRCAVPMIGL